MNKFLFFLGAILIIASLFWKQLSKIPLFHLPGDIIVNKPGFKFYFPIVSMILISIVVSFLIWLSKKF